MATTSTVEIKDNGSLLPKSITNIFDSFEALTSTLLIASKGIERTATGIDELTTTALSIQNTKMQARLAEL